MAALSKNGVINNLIKIGYIQPMDYHNLDYDIAVRYHKNNAGNAGSEVAAVLDAVQMRIRTAGDAAKARRDIYLQYRNIYNVKNEDDILLIIVGDGQSNFIKGKNVVRINCSSARIRKSKDIDPIYNDAVEACEYLSNIWAASDRKNLLDYDAAFGKPYAGWVLTLLIAITAVFSLSHLSDSTVYAISPDSIKNGEYFQIVSYMFVHAGFFHLLLNMLALWYFGKQLIRQVGQLNFLLIYILGGIGAGVFAKYLFLKYVGYSVPTVGASGAIFAVIGATTAGVILNNCYINNKISYTVYTLILLFVSSANFGVDWMCHIVGFIFGAIIMIALKTEYDENLGESAANVAQYEQKLKEKWEMHAKELKCKARI